MSELHDWLSLYLAPGLGNILMARLLAVYGEPAAVLKSSPKELCQVPGIGKKMAQRFNASALRRAADHELERAEQENVTILSWQDSKYPEMLRHIYNPPSVLYVKGDVELLSSFSIAMVGSRAATVYGTRIAEDMARRFQTGFGGTIGRLTDALRYLEEDMSLDKTEGCPHCAVAQQNEAS